MISSSPSSSPLSSAYIFPRRRLSSPSFLPLSSPPPKPPLPSNSGEIKPDVASNSAVYLRRVFTAIVFLSAVVLSCFVLYRATDSVGLKMPMVYYYYYASGNPDLLSDDVSSDNSRLADSKEFRLEKVLNDAAMEDKTVILTTLNEAWASPNSIIDLFLESFRYGEHTRKLLNHLVIIALDMKAFSRCLDIHTHCFALVNEGVNFSSEAYFMTPAYLKMMWSRIFFLQSVLELGFNFVFTDADVMWFRDPFPHFYFDADFQIACDHFSGISDGVENKPNGGFKFVRSNNRSIEFYKYWYSSREKFPGLHDQDVLNIIKNGTFIQDIGLKMRFLSTAYFGGFCEPSRDLNEVCTMHANCCFGLDSKLHDLRILLQDWKSYMSLPPRFKGSPLVSWRVPQNCSLDALLHFDLQSEDEKQEMDNNGKTDKRL
ncbi:uncharacterized protein At4g15970-like isoform X1 [Coffea arabica]|uniref:Glycosyltransferase n=1 Tax=Coffea arabica TaxID=13443 RepID=A0A6P6UYU4_COFAR|nr:uncharacterized protein At4g15970-like isoform X1 [Coffea arabica]